MKIVDTGVKFGMPTHSIFSPWGVELFSPMSVASLADYLEYNKPDIALFGGGIDLNPKIYHSDNIGSSCDGPEIRGRDLYEIQLWKLLKAAGVPTLGICRGSQFTCAMSGGKLYQDVSGHTASHHIEFADGTTMLMTSTHHQMMLPFEVGHELIAWAAERLSKYYTYDATKETVKYQKPEKEPEIVYFPKTNALAIQGHPEYLDSAHPTVVKVRELVNKYLLNGDMPNV